MQRIFSILFFSVSCFLFHPLSAQVKWDETIHDFGLLFQGDSAVTTFVFHNTGSENLALRTVKPSCGCTTPIWTTTAIKPGSSGEIKVSYNSHLIGEFNKGIAVWIDSVPGMIELRVKGQVIPRLGRIDSLDPEDPFVKRMQSYKIQHSHIFLQSEWGEIGEVNSREMKRIEFKIGNFSIRSVKFFPAKQDSDEVIVSFPFTELRPGEEGTIIVIIDGRAISGSSRPFDYRAKVETDMRGTDRILEFRTSGVFKKLYTGTELTESPVIVFDSAFFDAGKILQGDFVNHEYVFRNTGKKPLNILDINAECGCTSVAAVSKQIQPGESSRIKLQFDSRGRAGVMQKKITIKTDDLNHPETILEFRVEVETDPFHSRPGKEPGGE